jgi:XisH protein
MARRDESHYPVKRALEKAGWLITQDPLVLYFMDVRLKADLGGQRYLSADKDGAKIAVEIKDFHQQWFSSELQKMMGQLELYQWALDEQEPDRELFLAINQEEYEKRVQNIHSALHAVVMRKKINLIVFDSVTEVILQWIRH